MSLPNQFLKYGNKYMDSDWTQVIMKEEDLYTGLSYAAIQRRSNGVAKMARENIYTQTDVEGFEHPYLQKITESRTFPDNFFWFAISTYLDLKGAYYLMAVRNFSDDGTRFGEIQEFKLLNPYNIQRVMRKGDLEIAGYIETRKGMQREIPKEMIIEIRELNPFDWDKEFSMTDAAKESQFTLKTAGDYTRHSLRNNINSPGIVTTDVLMEDEMFENFRNRVKGHKKGEPLFGNGAGTIKWQDMNIDLSKSALKDVNQLNIEQLFSVYTVSKTRMGIEQSGVTRETSKVQSALFIEDAIIPRTQMILDAMNQDYITKYPNEYDRTKAEMYVNNPLAADHDSDLKKTEVLTKQSDLYTSLINKGYTSDVAGAYVTGEIGIDELGEPTNPPVMTQLPEQVQEPEEQDNSIQCCEHHTNQFEDLQGQVQQQEGSLKNIIANIQQEIVADAIKTVEEKVKIKIKNQFEEETELITDGEKRRYINQLEAALIAFYGIVINLQGGKVMRSRTSQYALSASFRVDKESNKFIKDTSSLVATSHIDTVINDIWKTAREEALKGKAQREIVNAIKEKYNTIVSETRAKTIARTETNRAFTMAQYDADRQFIEQNNLGSRVFKQWKTRSDNPCPFCKSLEAEGPIPFSQAFRELGESVKADGKKLDVNFQALEAGNAHPNCILPDTGVLAPNAEKLIRSSYSGDVIKFVTSNGRSLSVTPNHIMLTSRGWVAAKNIIKGDKIVNYSGWDEVTMGKIDPTNNNSPATIEQIFTSLIKSSGVSLTSVPVSPEYLKGDGAFGNGNIDIISSNSLLQDVIDPKFIEFVRNRKLNPTSSTFKTLPAFSNLNSMLIGLGAASDGLISSPDSVFEIITGSSTQEQISSILDSSNYNARLNKSSLNSPSVSVDRFSNTIKAFASLISFDDIVDINVSSYSGHIYDLQTSSKLYIANSFITSNCSCVYELIIDSDNELNDALKAKNKVNKQVQSLEKELDNILKSL